jgi:hypothetical protein
MTALSVISITVIEIVSAASARRAASPNASPPAMSGLSVSA